MKILDNRQLFALKTIYEWRDKVSIDNEKIKVMVIYSRNYESAEQQRQDKMKKLCPELEEYVIFVLFVSSLKDAKILRTKR